MRLIKFTALSLTLLWALAPAVWGQTCWPMILSAYPTGGQRGKTVEVTVNGAQNLYGAKQVLFEGTGVSAEVLPHEQKPDPNKPNVKPVVNTVTMRVTIAPDAPLGVREFRLVTPRGVSSVGQFVVGDEPEVMETEPNETLDKAQAVTLPVTVNGRIQAGEDVDCFKFSAKAGEQITFSVNAARLEDKIHDLAPGSGGEHVNPILFLYEASGNELASNDNYFRADPLLSYKFEKDGDYIIKIRDVRYKGMAHWVYRLTIAARPHVLTFPPSDLPEQVASDNNHTPEQADSIASIPCAIMGRLKEKGERDFYTFRAEKGQTFVFEVVARRYGSLIHSSLTILDGKGNVLTSADDSLTITGAETRLEFTAPDTGNYIVRVRDLFREGGEDFLYRLIVKPLTPDFTLRCNPDKFNVGRGGHFSIWVLATRTGGFTGDINLEVVGLPPGVTASSARIPAHMTQTVIVLSAAADAPLAATFVAVRGTATVMVDGKPQTLTRTAIPLQEIYFPGGGLGQIPVNTTTAAVTEEPDIVVTVEPQNITVAPGSTVKIDVT
ncbi:MAG: PPC domain-containing protein, partial [Abditibacteriales bacterium]|nr:PPC domain-containing protein [Abditibacteriales bacterium]MDW8367902.1 PPC domain-containing protein [Abditibacteriales bacterium]